jgi:hypothetical protein
MGTECKKEETDLPAKSSALCPQVPDSLRGAVTNPSPEGEAPLKTGQRNGIEYDLDETESPGR